MRTFRVEKRHISKLLFLGYFFVYAISPLTCTVPDRNIHDSSYNARSASTGVKSIHVLLWELISDEIIAKPESPDNHETETVIIRKKRAIIPENTAAKLFVFDDVSVQKDGYPFAQRTAYRLKIIQTR